MGVGRRVYTGDLVSTAAIMYRATHVVSYHLTTLVRGHRVRQCDTRSIPLPDLHITAQYGEFYARSAAVLPQRLYPEE